MMPELRTERLVLRPFAARDMAAYIAYYTGPRTGGVGGPKPAHVVAERFLGMAGQWVIRGFGRYAIALDDTTPAIGHAGVQQIEEDQEPELTWTLWDAVHEGKGYATEAADASARAYLADHNGPLPAHILPDNVKSLAVAARLGMVEDVNGQPPQWMSGAKRFLWGAA